MTKRTESPRTLELSVEVDAPIEAVWKALTEAEGIANWFGPIVRVSKPGEGGEITVAWSEEMAITSRVDEWEPNRRVRWVNDTGMMGPSTVIAIDFHLEAAGGKTRVRFVQSGFGESEGWDDFFEGTETGWRYFLLHLGFYLERHRGRTRRLIWERVAGSAARDEAWRSIASQLTGVAPERTESLRGGESGHLETLADIPTPSIVTLTVPGRGVAVWLPELEDSILFVELEPGQGSYHVGWYLSVYDASLASELEAPFRAMVQHPLLR